MAQAREWAERLGKTTVLCADSPNFIVNRVRRPLYYESQLLVTQGVAPPVVDAAVRGALGHRMGPLTLLDFTGLVTHLGSSETALREFGDPRYRPIPLTRQMVRAGTTGRAAGRGYYDYATAKPRDAQAAVVRPPEPSSARVRAAGPDAARLARWSIDGDADVIVYRTAGCAAEDVAAVRELARSGRVVVDSSAGGWVEELPPGVGWVRLHPAEEAIFAEVVADEVAGIEPAYDIVDAVGAASVPVPALPGLIVDRLMHTMTNEAVTVVEEGTATAEDIDLALRLGMNHPVGPLAYLDRAGPVEVLTGLRGMLDRFGDPRYRRAVARAADGREPPVKTTRSDLAEAVEAVRPGDTVWIGNDRAPRVRLPGGGGAPDAATGARDLLLLYGGAHPCRLVARVEHVTAAPAPDARVRLLTRWGLLWLGPSLRLVMTAGDDAAFAARLRDLGIDTAGPSRRSRHRIRSVRWPRACSPRRPNVVTSLPRRPYVVEELDDLRRVVRDLVGGWDFTPRCDAWMRGHAPAFSRELARRGLIGITWPSALGGGGRSNVARLVVTEELLRVGAPVAAHWIADRQIGPAILRDGSARLQEELLPGIAAGRITFCLGMSETEAGSDLASVRTRAIRDGGGWRVTGRKIWTTHAHHATHAYVLARTGDGGDKHDGLSEFVVDMSAPGVAVRRIHDLGGEHHFNEVVLDDVFVPADHVLGAEGAGWKQVTEQLSFERGGMERVLSTYPLLAGLAERELDVHGRSEVGALVARLMSLRELACRVAESMDAGRAPAGEAAVLKYLGTTFERDVVDVARTVSEVVPVPGGDGLAGLLAQAQLAAPGFSIRGGTDEMLLTVVSRQAPAPEIDDVGRMADEVLGSAPEDPWATAAELGWTAVGVAESDGGSGGSFTDLAALVRAVGRHARPMPLAEVAVARALSDRPAVAAVAADLTAQDGRVTATADVPWPPQGGLLLIGDEAAVRVVPEADGVTCRPWNDLSGRSRARIECRDVQAEIIRVPEGTDPAARLAVLRAHAVLGAVEGACRLTREHVTTRVQFGRPLSRLQAVAHRLAEMECARVLLEVAASAALGLEPARVAAATALLDPTATTVARLAHQLHGAMGITQESPLHRYTTLLWSFRDEPGPTRRWRLRLYDAVGSDPDALWAAVTTRPGDR